MQTVIDILAIPDKDERNFKAVLDHYIKANTRGVFFKVTNLNKQVHLRALRIQITIMN